MRIHTVWFVTLGVLCGCAPQDQDRGDHVWQEQTDTIERAQAVEDRLQDSAEQRWQDMEAREQEMDGASQ